MGQEGERRKLSKFGAGGAFAEERRGHLETTLVLCLLPSPEHWLREAIVAKPCDLVRILSPSSELWCRARDEAMGLWLFLANLLTFPSQLDLPLPLFPDPDSF